MKFTSIFALGAFALPAVLASPLVGGPLVPAPVPSVPAAPSLINLNIEVEVEATVSILEKMKKIVPAPVQKRGAISTPQGIIDTCHGLLLTIQVYTGACNKTVDAVPAGSQPSPADIIAIKVQLNLIVEAIKVVATALGAVGGLVKCTVAEVETIVGCLVKIIFEIVYTLLHIIKTLGIKALLTDIIHNIFQILGCLILIIENLVGGVLALVFKIINVPFVLELVGDLLSSLLSILSNGKIL